MHACTHTHTHTHTHIHMHRHVHTNRHKYAHRHSHSMQAHTRIHAHTNKHTHTHTHFKHMLSALFMIRLFIWTNHTVMCSRNIFEVRQICRGCEQNSIKLGCLKGTGCYFLSSCLSTEVLSSDLDNSVRFPTFCNDWQSSLAYLFHSR